MNETYSTEQSRWQAVQRRDAAAVGAFFYAVTTTGIVCKPGCASRAPRRENVSFFASLDTALRAGFRPCRRCRPSNEASTAPADVIAACRAIETADTPPTLNQLAATVGVSPAHLHRRFKRVLGVTPKAYANAVQTRRFRVALDEEPSVTDAAYAAGYGSASRAYANGGASLGMTPTQFRRRGSGIDIEIASARCNLGALAVAASARGVCAVELGANQRELNARLAERYSNAQLIKAGRPVNQWLAQIVARIESPEQAADIPLDIRGSAFQIRVWRALCDIPSGTTRSYSEVATSIGQPGAARAVARACATNSIAVVVPCHRVVRGDGSVSGYRWGVERKTKLLGAEARAGDAPKRA